MKQLFFVATIAIFLTSCAVNNKLSDKYKYQTAIPDNNKYNNGPDPITQSLFADKNATISEENIQKILNGEFKLPQNLRVAILNLNSYRKYNYWDDENYLKTQQAYFDLLTNKLKLSNRIVSANAIPELLLPRAAEFTQIREAAVRMQADLVIAYHITTDVYSNYKLFTKSDIKAFATTQMLVLDIRTGLVPFSTVVTKDVLSKKLDIDTDRSEAVSRIQREAALLTIEEAGKKIQEYLAK